jgi:hypothetical protein
MGQLTLREALAAHKLDAFVLEQQKHGAELVSGSELERGLALLITQRRAATLSAAGSTARTQHRRDREGG